MSTNYVDSDGVPHDHMPFSEALDVIHELAASNVLRDDQAEGDHVLVAERARQREAVDMMHDLVVNYSDQLDGSFLPPEKAADRPESREKRDASADLTVPSNYLRLCLELAGQAFDPDAARDNPDLEDDVRRQSQALDLGWDLLDLHGQDLDVSLTTIPSPRL